MSSYNFKTFHELSEDSQKKAIENAIMLEIHIDWRPLYCMKLIHEEFRIHCEFLRLEHERIYGKLTTEKIVENLTSDKWLFLENGTIFHNNKDREDYY